MIKDNGMKTHPPTNLYMKYERWNEGNVIHIIHIQDEAKMKNLQKLMGGDNLMLEFILLFIII